ncbi:ATP-binding protein [Paenibacillus planticolens]|uniref:Nuclease SbcCD subunit C n=1 Tax=Paenibacillus planticolens TaxID=2654976 RepID=A0ABX1ZW97_9BACL|nr:AAA family ATPase [Paenibacillus planticolens]NOV04314.1 AAA family ATPase [Paenibacillus planticolens]
MTNYTIDKVLIENFKGIDHLILDWSNGQLIVLDGPNGFGKTTIFDAIELALTGKIDRIKKPQDARVAYSDVLFSNNPSKDVLLKVQLTTNTGEKGTIVKSLPTSKRLTGIDKQPGKWEIFDTYLLETFDSSLTNDKKSTQKEVSEKFGVDELERLYSLFYYIQQEENTSFLKRPGKERMAEISRLFDTKDEVEEKKYFEGLVKFIDQEKKLKSTVISNIKIRLESYKNHDGVLNHDVTEYELLLGDITDKLWDRENLTVNNKEMRDKFIAELLSIEDFIIHFEQFKLASFNQRLNKYADNKILLQSTITASSFLDRYQEIKNMFEKQKKLRRYLMQLKDYQKSMFSINYDELHSEVEFDLITVKQKVETIRSQGQNVSMLSSIVSELNQTRDKLLEKLNAFHTHQGKSKEDCPFCGYDWGDHERLLIEFQAKKEYFSSLYDDSTKVQEQEIKDLFQVHFSAIIQWLEGYLSNPENSVSEAFYTQLEIGYRREKEIALFLDFCAQNNIDLSAHTNNQFNIPLENLEFAVENFSNQLRGRKYVIEEGYAEFDEKFLTFQTLYQENFNGLEANVAKVSVEAVERKKRYIDFQFFNQNEAKKVEDETLFNKINEDFVKLTKQSEQLKQIIETYDSSIKKHWKKIMVDIEVPFYIYSGKIMQNYQRGLGLFIKEKVEAESIVFVSDNASDHDALNFLSSGQLSALVISFTLSLNKVYGNKDLGVLLIDDPVQSMDEINMASLTELLRNDFQHKQIIISTHEDDVSRYLQYKFNKYGSNTLSFNMREESHLKILNRGNIG